jgi:hypothetical protein
MVADLGSLHIERTEIAYVVAGMCFIWFFVDYLKVVKYFQLEAELWLAIFISFMLFCSVFECSFQRGRV